MIPGLGPEARALLERAREGMSPDAAAIRRVRGKVGAAAGAGGVGLAVKLGAIVAGAVIAIGIGLSLRAHGGSDATATVPRVEPAVASESPASSRGTERVRAAASEPALPAVAIEAPQVAHHAHAHAAAPVESIEPPRAQPAEPVATATLSREVELLDLAMSSLRAGDARTALAAVRRHAAETANRGQLAEDAAAIEIEALCHLHDPTTDAKLEAFDARWPSSAQRSRLSNTCK